MPVAPLVLDSDLRIEMFPPSQARQLKCFLYLRLAPVADEFLISFQCAGKVLRLAGHRYADGLQMLDLLRE